MRFVCRFLAEPCRRDIWRRALGHADRVLDQVGCWAWCALVGPSKQFRGMLQQLGWGRSDSDNVRFSIAANVKTHPDHLVLRVGLPVIRGSRFSSRLASGRLMMG